MARLDLIGLVVKNMAASLRFYRLLGLEIPSTADADDHVEVIVGGMRIAWDELEMIKSFSPGWVEPVGHRMGLAFLCDSPAEVDALHERVLQAGHKSHKAPWDAFWGQRYAQVLDPDGNVIDLFAQLPA
ncbi:MAG: VOC family protein [Anaerolineales bacterium]|nr:VOC family protein [Anaerolineales bacterium]